MPDRYRVFHLIKGLGRGGAETLLSEGLRFADHSKFHYGYGFFLSWKDALVKPLQQNGAEVVCFKAKSPAQMLLSVPRVTAFLRKWKPDLIHCHLPLAGVVGRLSGRLLGCPVVYTEHNVMERYHPWTRKINLLTWKLQREVVAVSEEVASSIQSSAGSAIPVHVITNGVAVETFTNNAEDRIRIRMEYGIPSDAPVVGTVAVFRKQKNLGSWLAAAKRIREHHPMTHFLLVGDGPLRRELEQLTTAMQLEKTVHFTGLQANVSPYLDAMDVFMNSSVFEGLPVALLEAMAMKLPVVATRVGGVPELIENGVSGLLVSPDSTQELAEKVSLLLSDRELCRKFGDAGRRIIEQRFSIQRMIERLEKVYLNLLTEQPVVT